jgi:D-serine deaminase-like pyridoxal phosphate-dependent protein
MHIPTGLETPVLLLDLARMERNVERMQSRINALGVRFRPHVKTSKCPEVRGGSGKSDSRISG